MKIISILVGILKNCMYRIYYRYTSMAKNVYPCKLLRENISNDKNETIVVYKVLGDEAIKKISLKKLLSNKPLLTCFNPTDAVKLGYMAFGEIILALPLDKRKGKFEQIKNKLLDYSCNDFDFEQKTKEMLSLLTSKNPCSNQDKIQQNLIYNTLFENNNYYPYRMVRGEIEHITNNTIIIYTILEKRDGYKIKLQDLMNRKSDIIEKFHQTDAIKLGFITAGDSAFYTIPRIN